MVVQLAALLGSVAYGIRRLTGSILSLVGLRVLERVVVPGLVAILAVAAVVSARDTAEILASRPRITEATLTEVARHDDLDASVWYTFDALIDDSSLPTPADRGTTFFLARDPDDPGQGLLVRSPLDDESFRRRVLTATLVDDPALVTAALEAFGTLPGGVTVDEARYLHETAAGGDAEEAVEPSDIEADAGASVLSIGRLVAPASFAVERDGSHLYLFADPDGGRAMILRSPHPPDLVPVRLQGLYLRDTFDLGSVLESDWFAGLDADVPTDRALQADYRPPITVPASWIPTIVFAVLGVLLLASQLVGYPVFRPAAAVAAGRSIPVGDSVDVEITGRLARDRRLVELERSPGAVERLSIEELALRMWRYGLLAPDLSRREAERQFVETAKGRTDRLVVHERDQSTLLIVEGGTDGVRVRAGRLHRIGRSGPAVHVRQERSDAYLGTRTEADRDRVAAALAEEAGQPSA